MQLIAFRAILLALVCRNIEFEHLHRSILPSALTLPVQGIAALQQTRQCPAVPLRSHITPTSPVAPGPSHG
jgi:hypothetical protein